MTLRLPAVAAVAVLLSAAACRTTGKPYVAPGAEGAPLVDRYAAARLRILVDASSDDRVTPPWKETAEKAADAVALQLGQAGFRITRGLSISWDVRVTVSAPLRGPDLSVTVDANHEVLDRVDARGVRWGSEELAELARAVRERMERSEAVAALAGVPPRGKAAAAATPPSPEPSAATTVAPASPARARKRLAVLDFRGSAPAQVLALLADQTRAAAAEAGRTSATTVLTRESVLASLREKGRAVEPCADGACELETARAVGADLVVTGEITAVGAARFLVLKLVDATSGSLVASTHAQAKDDLELALAAKPAAAALFR